MHTRRPFSTPRIFSARSLLLATAIWLPALLLPGGSLSLARPAIAAPRSTSPLAVVTQASGGVVVQQGGKKVAVKAGTTLRAGDRIEARGGSATLFFLNGQQRKLSGQGSLVVAAPASKAGGSLLRSAYVGLSQGFASGGGRVAATMRTGALQPLSPLDTALLDDRGAFKWNLGGLDAAAIVGYEVEVQQGGKTVARRRTSWPKAPLSAFKLPRDVTLLWHVTPLGRVASVAGEKVATQPIVLWRSRDVSFSMASPGAAREVQAALSQLDHDRTLAAGDRIVARAALLGGRNYYDAALDQLRGASTPQARALRVALLPPSASSALAQAEGEGIKDEVLEGDIYAKDVLSPRALKTYADPYGNYSLQIPLSWGHEITDVGNGVRQTMLAAYPFASPRLAVSVKPHTAGGSDAVVQLLTTTMRQQKAVVTASPVQKVSWHGRMVSRQQWTAKSGPITTLGTLWGWTEKGRDIVASTAWYPGDESRARQLDLCLGSLQISARPRRASPLPNPWDQETNASLAREVQTVLRLTNQFSQDLTAETNRLMNLDQSRAGAVQPAEFERYRTAYVAAPANTLQKSRAASRAAGLAAALGWQAARNNHLAEARRWFALRASLAASANTHSLGYIAALMAVNEAHIAPLRRAVAPLTIANRLNSVLDLRQGLQQNYLIQAQTVALENNDAKTLESLARRGWRINCQRLESKALGGHYASAAPTLVAGDRHLASFEAEWRLYRRLDASDLLLNLCDAALRRFDFASATAFAQRALVWRRALPATFLKRDESGALRKLALIADRSGDYLTARNRYEALVRMLAANQAKQRAYIATLESPDTRFNRRADLSESRVVALSNLGTVMATLGDFKGARARYNQAMALLDAPDQDVVDATRPPALLGPSAAFYNLPKRGKPSADAQNIVAYLKQRQRATLLNNISDLELSEGHLDQALQMLDESTKILLTIGEDQTAAIALMNRAGIFRERDETFEMAKSIRTAYDIFTQLHDTQHLVVTAKALANIAQTARVLDKADAYGAQSLGLARIMGDPYNIAASASTLASIRIDRWQSAPAHQRDPKLLASSQALLREAEAASARVNYIGSTRAVMLARAQLQTAQGDFVGALSTYKKLMTRVEAVRSNAESETGYANLRENASLYETTIRLQLQLGRPTEAFDTLARSRSKRLFDSLSLSNLKSPDPALQNLLDKATQLENQQTQLQHQLRDQSGSAATDLVKIQNLRNLLAATQAEYQAVANRITEQNPGFKKAIAVAPLSVQQAQSAIPEGALLLQYAPIGDKLYIFALTRHSLKTYSSSASTGAILAQVGALRAALDATGKLLAGGADAPAPENDTAFRAASTALYAALVAPVAPQWKTAQVVAIIPSGELYYLPFHALAHETNGKLKFWIEEKPLAYLMGADVLAAVKQIPTAAQGGVLALGDPPGANLPAARQEVAAVARLFPASQALVGASASKEVLVQNKALHKRAVHLAAHGVLDPLRPERSFIQLAPDAQKGDDGKLRVSEIYGLNLKGVDLVTLSACQTALGAVKPDGAEITSLAESFASAGTPSVVASLWNVEDTSTRTLMEKFYGGLADGTPKAQALRDAQLALLKNPPTRHPFFWAPFELLGDWR